MAVYPAASPDTDICHLGGNYGFYYQREKSLKQQLKATVHTQTSKKFLNHQDFYLRIHWVL